MIPARCGTSGAVALHHRAGHQPAVVSHAHPALVAVLVPGGRGSWGSRPRAAVAPGAGRRRSRSTRTDSPGAGGGAVVVHIHSQSPPSPTSKCLCSNGSASAGTDTDGDREGGELRCVLHAGQQPVDRLRAADAGHRPAADRVLAHERHGPGDREARPPERRADLVPHERVAARGRQQVVVRPQDAHGRQTSAGSALLGDAVALVPAAQRRRRPPVPADRAASSWPAPGASARGSRRWRPRPRARRRSA